MGTILAPIPTGLRPPAPIPMVRTATLVLVAWLAALGAADAPLLAQAREHVVYVTVVDKDGRPRTELSAADITIREDGAAREVLRITPATGPFPIAVLVDTSANTEYAVPDLRAGLTAFAGALGEVGPLALIGFGDRPDVLSDYAAGAAGFTRGIGRVFARPMAGATLIEAVHDAAAGLRRRESERAAIVVVSTSGPELSTMQYTRALDQLAASGAALHAVTLTRPAGTPFTDEVRQRDTLLDRGVQRTGGFRRDVIASQSMPSALADLGRLLAHQFRVVYARPQTLIPPKSIEVRAVPPGTTAYGGPAREQPR